MPLPVYTSPDDRYRRLEGCFALIDNEPFVMRAGNNGLKEDEVYIQNISPKTQKRSLIAKREFEKVQYTRPDIRVKDLPLGYVNVDGHPIYVTRHPTRSTSVGPARSNLFYESSDRGSGFYAFCSGYGDSYLTQVFLNEYNPKAALDAVASNDMRGAALSTEIAVKKVGPKMFSILYKDTTLGYTKDLSEPFECILPKGFISLISDKLEKVGVNVKH